MTKADVISFILKETGQDNEIVSSILEGLFKAIKQNVSEGRPICVRTIY